MKAAVIRGPEYTLKDEWVEMTDAKKRNVIVKLYDPGKVESDEYLERRQKYFVDQVLTTNGALIRLWRETRLIELYNAFDKKISMTKIKRWQMARAYLKYQAQQLVLEL